MANPRIGEELALLRTAYPELEYRTDGHWVRIAAYPVPDGLWDRSQAAVCFQIPEQIPGQAPYGFWVRPGLSLRSGGQVDNYAYPAPTAFGEDWGKFSWQLLSWNPKAEIVAGENMLNFALSIADRLGQGS